MVKSLNTIKNILRRLKEMPANSELRLEGLSEVCQSLDDLRKIAEVCEEKQVAVVFADDDFVINGRQELTLAEALGVAIKARGIIASAQTRVGLDKARKAGKRLGSIPGKRKVRKLDGKKDEIQKLLDIGATHTAIARMFDVSYQTLLSFMKDNGMKSNHSAGRGANNA